MRHFESMEQETRCSDNAGCCFGLCRGIGFGVWVVGALVAMMAAMTILAGIAVMKWAGESADTNITALRSRQIKNFHLALMASQLDYAMLTFFFRQKKINY
ncbi:hypothetical protein LguiB_000718 [Lonicera macranthoides]